MNSMQIHSGNGLIQEKAALYGNHHADEWMIQKNETKKKRIVVKKGSAFVVLNIRSIAIFYFDRVGYALDFSGNKYQLRQNLSSVEEHLDKKNFFRINREAIVNIDAIVEFSAAKGGRITLMLAPGVGNQELCVSQSLAPEFRQWINSL
jgi:DNA-binding LytR/AlgR family response regulator